MSDIQLTLQQQKAVDNRGGSLLVSAAAGSGKTKVLVERVFSYLMESGCNVDDFLIITYTRAAAAELRTKLAAALNKLVAENPNDRHLRQQLFRVYQADIKTIGGFCTQLLRQHVHLLEPVAGRSLTPDFRVLDESEAALLRDRALEQTMESFYEAIEQGDGEFALLAETLGAGRDDRGLQKLIPELYGKLQSHPYPALWLEQAAESWRSPPTRLADSVYGQTIMASTVRRAQFWDSQLERAVYAMADCEPVRNAYADRFLEVADQLRLYESAAKEGWDAMAAVQPVFRRAGIVKGEENAAAKEAARTVMKKCKEELEKMTAPYQVSEQEHLDDLRAIAPAMLGLLRLTGDFARRYQEEKVRRNAVDFSDQEHYALTLLAHPDGTFTELGEQVSQRYQEVMVDEYQDTNEVQNCIFRAVSDDGRRLFAVGDVKQSIYRFRLADPTIFLEKYRSFADAAEAVDGQPRRMVLSRNFRSREEILDVTNFIFSNIMSTEMGEMDYTDEEKLYFGAKDYSREKRDVEFHLLDVEDTEEEKFDRTEAEAQFVARRIRDLLDEGFPVRSDDGGQRPVRPEDIVILMRSPSTPTPAYVAALERLHIPCDGGESDDFFSAMEVAVMVSLLEIVDNPRQDVPLIAVLRSPLVGMTPDRLAMIRSLRPDGDYYDALCLDESADSRAFLSLLEELRTAAREMAADQLLWYIYDRCHVTAIFGAMADGETRQARLAALYDYARRTVQSGRTGLFDFIAYLHRLLEKGDVPDVTTATAAGGVRIMSVHSSKGLEFPVVVLCDLNRQFNLRDTTSPVLVHPQLGIGADRIDRERHIRYDTISKTALAQTMQRESKAEEMRILYVALTRAKEKLIMVDAMKSPLKRLRDFIAVSDLPVPPEAVSSARTPGDWLLLPLLHTWQAEEIYRYADLWPTELGEAPESLTIRFHRLWQQEETTAEERSGGEAAPQRAEVQPDEAALAFVYPHAAASRTPSKVTATQLKGRELDQEIADGTIPYRFDMTPEKPRFMEKAQGLSAAQRGTAMHTAMQYLDFDGVPVAQQVASLTEKRLLTPEQASSLDVAALERFLASPLAQRIRQAPRVWREYRFALLVDGSIYDESAAGEEMLLQGVADCVFETPEGLAVVDFKTDRITAAEVAARAETYRPQLSAYAQALSQILERPVTERILYFFTPQTEISL